MKRTLTRKRFFFHLAGYAALFLLAFLVCPLFGAEKISWARAISGWLSHSPGPDGQILFLHRLPRVMLALLVGGSLSGILWGRMAFAVVFTFLLARLLPVLSDSTVHRLFFRKSVAGP